MLYSRGSVLPDSWRVEDLGEPADGREYQRTVTFQVVLTTRPRAGVDPLDELQPPAD